MTGTMCDARPTPPHAFEGEHEMIIQRRERPREPHSAHPAIRSDYLRLSIISTAPKPKRSTLLLTAVGLIAVGAALFFVFIS
jgi:hypothetical protein